MNWVGAVLLAAIYGFLFYRQIRGRGPPAWTIFLAGGFLFVVLGVLPIPAATEAVAAAVPILVFLFALFLFAAGLERSGAIDHLARWLVSKARTPRDLPVVVFIGFGVLSAVVVNDALVILGVPLLILVARRLRVSAHPLLLTLAFGVTVGSVATPIGNPQNLLVAISSGFTTPWATFLRFLLLPTALCLVLGAFYLRRVFRGQLPATHGVPLEPPVALLPSSGWTRRLREHPALWIFSGTILVMVTLDVTAGVVSGPPVPAYAIALGGAVLLLLLSPRRTELLGRVNWTLLLLFIGLFVVVAGATASGVVQALEDLLPIPAADSGVNPLPAITLTSLVGSQLFSNVPWVALQVPTFANLGYTAGTPVAWLALAAMATLAGNLTLLGAASNLIIAEQAEKLGERLRLKEFLGYGAGLTAICVALVYLALTLGL